MNKNLPIHSQLSHVILAEAMVEILSVIKIPTVWNTQSQSGKTTVLSRIAAKEMLDVKRSGDIWIISPNVKSDTNFFESVLRQIPEEEKVRKTQSRLEVLSTMNRILTIRSLPREPQCGLKLDPPKLIIFDEVGNVSEEMIKRTSEYLREEDLPNIRIIGATTSSETDFHKLFEEHFKAYEEIWTGCVGAQKHYNNLQCL